MAILSKLRRHYLAHTWRVVEGSTFVGRKLLSSAAVVASGCALFSRIVVSSMESAAAIVVEPVTGLEYPFFAMTEVFLAFKRPYLRHANGEVLQFISYRVDFSAVSCSRVYVQADPRLV